MQALTEWMRSILMIYFLMMIILYFSAGDSYKKFIRFFMGIVLVLTLFQPFMNWFGKAELFREKIAYESFQQNIQQAQTDFERMEDVGHEIYRKTYEQGLEMQFLEDAKEQLLDIEQVSVSLNSDYEPQQITIREGLCGDGELLKQYLMKVYGMSEGMVSVEK